MIARYSPIERFRSFDRFSKLMEDLWGSTNGHSTAWFPSFDVVENDKETKFVADLPGLSEKDVSVELLDGLLRVCGERKDERDEKTENYVLCERIYGSFERSFPVDPMIKPDQIKAEFEDGVLTIKVPRVEAKEKAQKIAIKSH